MLKRPTQADVARLAGVSRATVSLVVNGKDTEGIAISRETRQRVLGAVEELGYVIDSRAQSLRSGDTKTIGVLLPLYENPFFWQVLQGISAEAAQSGYKILLTDNRRATEDKQQLIRELAEQSVDGFIILSEPRSLPDKIVEQLSTSSHPIVEFSSTASSVDSIHHNYSEGTEALMRYLFDLGHRHISFLYGVEDEIEGIDRLNAYKRAFVESALPFDESWIYRCGPSIDEGYRTALRILQQAERPTALLAINDLQGMATIRAAGDLGLDIPGDISVASFDNIPFADICVPRLTTVACEPEKSGRNAVRLLLERLSDRDGQFRTIKSGWELIVRESTGPAPQASTATDRRVLGLAGGDDDLV